MEIKIISFGKIAEIIGSQMITVPDQTDTDQINDILVELFPDLRSIKYRMALNEHLVNQNIVIVNGSVIAIMPPFSGG